MESTRFLHYIYNWRAGASQPSRTTGAIFLYIYIFLYGRCTYRNVLRISKSANAGRTYILQSSVSCFFFLCGSLMDSECTAANVQP